MARFDLLDIKKQAALYLREKVMDARLAFTDVSRTQLLTEEATNADPWGPETRTLAMLSDAAYEREEYDRIVPVLQGRLEMIGKRPWRQVYKTLVVLEYLLTHGPGSLLNDFRSVMLRIEELCQFTFVDHQGVDRGLSIRKKADWVLELLSETEVWKEERNRAQKISHGIKGFGSNSVIEISHVAGKSLEHQGRSEVSVAEGAESPSTASLMDEMVNEKTKAAIDVTKASGAEWYPFEKSLSTPRQGSSSFPSSNEVNPEPMIYNEHTEFLAAWSPFKKALSSPGFRDNSQSTWQPFRDETVREPNDAGALVRGPSYDEDSVLLQVSEVHVQSSGKNENRTVDLDDLHQHGKTSHRKSVRHMFGLHRPVKESAHMNSSETHVAGKFVAGSTESADNRTPTNSSTKLDGSRDIVFAASEHVVKLPPGQEVQHPHGFSKFPALPPPPRLHLRSKLQRHLHIPSLIDS